jgi:2-desacetyl-2-hydroxyethyl bacteriochlorophyllide A dehydrogenase
LKAAVLTAPETIEIKEVPSPEPAKGEVLVRIRKAGICGSDFSVFTGRSPARFPLIPGHEAVGEIAGLGDGVAGLEPGQRVTIQPNFACGECRMCLSGMENICINKVRLGIDINGVFAEYVSVPARYIWRLPDTLSDSVGTLVEPLSVAIHAFTKSPPKTGERVLVFGAGAIGLLLVELARLNGAWIAALDIAEPRLAVAIKMGAQKIARSLAELDKDLTEISHTYETSGTTDAFSQIVEKCASGTGIVLTGLPKSDAPVSATLITRKELIIQGAMIYKDEFRVAIDLLNKGAIQTDLLITETYPVEELAHALADFPSPDRIKTLIAIN